ncbi:MAG: hypothetical protein WCK59_01160 [Candidatus Falkowbacteria bacterium]
MKNFIILLSIIITFCLIQLFLGSDSVLRIAAAFSMSSIAFGIWLSLEAHSLKTKSEKAEIDIKLMSLFTKIMGTAHGRGGYYSSEKTIEKAFDCGLFGEGSVADKSKIEDFTILNKKISAISVLTIPVGAAEQDAAIAAIGKLAERHEVLRDVAIEGLQSLNNFKSDVANKYLEKLIKK